MAANRRMIIFGNSTIIFKIFIYFAIPSLQSDTSLNNLKHKAMTGIGREACANNLTSHDVISLFFFLSLLIHSDISEEEKAVLGVPKFKKNF